MKKSITIRIMVILISITAIMMVGSIFVILANKEVRESSNNIMKVYIDVLLQKNKVENSINGVEIYTSSVPESDGAAYVLEKKLNEACKIVLEENKGLKKKIKVNQ